MTSNIEQLKAAAKSLMKKQGRTYQELSEYLGLSLVSVKRIMSKEEVSLSRFLEICDWLETNLTELEKIADYNRSNKKTYFTPEQEVFLSKSPEAMSFLFHLYTEETPEVIQKKYNLSSKSLNLYLLRLEKHNLVKKVSGRYKPVYKDFPSPIPYGQLRKTQYENVIATSVSFFRRYNTQMSLRKNPEEDKGSLTNLAVLGVSRASYLNWFERYKSLQAELSSIATVEEKIEKIKDKKTIVMMHMHAVIDEADIELEGIKNMFGRPVDIT